MEGSFYFLKMFTLCVLMFAFSAQATLGNIACENLNTDSCSLAVSSNGKRCVLEKIVQRSGEEVFVCSTSQIDAEHVTNPIECENLNKDSCCFAVSSNGKRCVLEKIVRRSGEEVFVCSTSQIDAEHVTNWIESDKCVEACGLDRNVLGISSYALLDSRFVQKLCSTRCYNGCPNIVDLYFSLAVGEGVYLPSLCRTQGDNKRRGTSEIRSSGYVAPGPTVPAKLVANGSPNMAPSPIGPY